MEQSKKEQYKEVLHQRDYMKLLIANTISRFGDSIDSVAFIWLVYLITKSASWSAIMMAINYLPTVLLQPFTGTLVEGMDKKKIMVITDFVRAFAVSGLAILYILNMVTPLTLVILTLIISTSEAFTQPASSALTPRLLSKELYNIGASLSGTLTSVVQLIGLACAGVIIGFLGIQAAILIDGVTFLLSAVITLFLSYQEKDLRFCGFGSKEFFQNFKEGISYAMKNEIIRNVLIIAVILNGVLVPANAFQAPLVKSVLQQGSQLISIMGITMVIGMMIGSSIFPFLTDRFSVRQRIAIPAMLLGIYYVGTLGGLLFANQVAWVYFFAGVSNFIGGLAVAVANATVSVMFMSTVDEKYMARVSGLMGSLAVAAMPVVSGICSLLALWISVPKMYVIGGTMCAIIGIVIIIKKVKFEEC